MRLTRALVPLATLALAACAIPPRVAPPTLRDDAPIAGVPPASAAAWPDANWWTRYGDPELDALVAKALADSPSLAVARARFAAAQSAVDVARAELGVRVDANAQVARTRLSEHGLFPTQFLGFTWYSQADIGAQFSYDFDWWGRKRAAVQASVDQVRAAGAERDAATLVLASGVVESYFDWQADAARLALARDAAANAERIVAIDRARARQGLEPPDVRDQAEQTLAAAREQVAALVGALAIRHAALAALIGVAPADLAALAPKPLPTPSVAVPADADLQLLARRPEIAASRWRVEAALARTEEARAAFYPDVSIKAMIGLSSIDLDKLFTAGSRTMSATPAIGLPIFDAGRLRARYGASRADLDVAIADYRASVIDAARDTAAQALTLEQIAARRDEHAKQIAAGERLLASAAARVKRGVVDPRNELAASTQLLAQRDADLVLRAQAIDAEIALIKALGGGFRVERNATTDPDRNDAARGAASADH